MAKSRLDEPFNAEEKLKLLKCPKANELLKELMPRWYTDETLEKEDWRLTYRQGSRIHISNRNYSGKGVKKAQYTLNPSGVRILKKHIGTREGYFGEK